MYCCFTGHRPEHLPWGTNEDDARCIKLKNILYDLIEEAVSDGYTDFLCGMARGFDTYAAEAVLALSERYPHISLHAVLPCPDQSEKWPVKDRERYHALLEKASSQILVSPFYTNTCMLTRNRYMVNESARIIAGWNGNFRGGTAYTVRYAKTEKKEIYLLRPEDATFKVL